MMTENLLIAHISFGQSPAVVLRSHDLTVGTSRTDGQQVAALSPVQVDLLGEDVGRLTDGTHHVVSLHRLVAGDVLDLMIGLIEGRTNEVGKACIDDGELLDGAFLNIYLLSFSPCVCLL